jgi:hypothetical protein
MIMRLLILIHFTVKLVSFGVPGRSTRRVFSDEQRAASRTTGMWWASILVLLDPSVEVPPVEMNAAPDTNDR